MGQKKQYWLMKSEPTAYSISDLKKDKSDLWDGVRNYQARNFMMHNMQVGDEVLFYHSNAFPSGIAGLAFVSHRAVADPTQFDPKSQYYDPKATPEKPRWFCVKVTFKAVFSRILSLAELKTHKALKDLLVLKKGQRLSIMPVTASHYQYILKIAKQKG